MSNSAQDGKQRLVAAISALNEAEGRVDTLVAEVLRAGASVYWFTCRNQQDYRQEGRIVSVGSWGSHRGHACTVLNLKTNREVRLSLYDLRFFLSDSAPQKNTLETAG